MRDWNVYLLRKHVLQYCVRLRSFISMLQDTEPEAHERLVGEEGVKRISRITDFVLAELGHATVEDREGSTPTVRAARQVVGKR